MKAVTVEPGTAGSVRLEDVPEPGDIKVVMELRIRRYRRRNAVRHHRP
jgi:hypothetical protein